MRIAIVSSSVAPERVGGSEVYAGTLAPALAEAHDVRFFSGARMPVPGVHSVRLPALPDLSRNEPRAGKALWHLRDQWLPAVHQALTRGLRDFGPDVVHTHHPQGLSAAVFTAVAAANAAHVHTAHDANAFCVRTTMTANGRYCGGRCARCLVQRQVRTRILSRSLGRLIAPSSYACNLHVQGGVVPANRAETVRQGAPAGTTRLRDRGRRPFTIGFLGALAPHKGVPTLLEAFESALSEWRLRIAGSGPMEGPVSQLSQADARVDFVGYVADRDKDDFFDSLDAIVIPSEVQEFAPLVAVEAAVRGLPAVVSDRGGLPEVPEARVFPAGDQSELLEALRSLADSPDALREASRRLIATQERFLWSTHVRSVERVLESAASER